jgi:PAS domain S-box-containing protein
VQPADVLLLTHPPVELFDQFAAGIFVTDALGQILAVNPAAAEMLGYTQQEELVGKNVAAFTHPDEIARRASFGALGPGRSLAARLRLLHKDGRYRAIDGKARVLEDGRIVTVVHDVTALVTAEHDLNESAEQLRFVANAVPALIAYVDTDARYVWGNESYRRWFGYPPDHIRGRHISEVLGATAWAAVRPYAERALAGEEVTFHHRLVYKIGPARDVRATYTPHLDGDGRVRGFVVLSNDISEIRSAEHALRRSERMLEQSQTTAHVGGWEVILADGRPTESGALVWSDEAYRIFGFEPGSIELTHQVFYGVLHPDDREAMRAASNAGLQRGEPFEKEYRIVRPDGTVRVIHAWTRFEREPGGKPTRMFGTCQDITERKQAEQEREDALRELREADRRKDEFLAMLSHELRNPLAPILNAVEILDRVGPGNEEFAARFRAIIARQVQHMKHLLDDLLDVSRVSQGKIQLRKESVELGTVLLQAVEVSRPMIVEKRQELAMTLAPGPLPLDADPTRLVQVFANLVNNAAKYTDAGGHIAVTASAEDGDAVVRVRDDGVGMSPELIARAFDLFVQETRSLDRAQGGLGIGLTMVRTLVKMHGGSVRAFSEGPGRGSEFVVRLPLATREEAPASTEEPPTTRTPERSLRVLVVDDNVDAANAVGHLLELQGHHVSVAYDGPGALAAAAATPPELVLLDIGLPGMDGYAVAARLREAGHRAVLVALTGYGQDEHLRRSNEAGFDHHLVKPLDYAVLGKITAGLRTNDERGKNEP